MTRLYALLLLASLTLSAQTPPAADYHNDPKFQKSLADAKGWVHQRGSEDAAIDSYKKANKIAGGQCLECLQAIIKLQISKAYWKDVIATSTALEQIATTPAEKANAAVHKGNAILSQAGDKPKPAQLNAADAAYRDALTQNGDNATALYQDGRVLAMLDRIEDARAQWTALLKVASPRDAYYLRAQHFIENPALAKETMAPAFTVKTLGGETFTLDNMEGRVVLIDFWATWCGPCNEELPNVKKIAKDFANDPFVLISVSWDASAQEWRDFIDKHEMTWNQYRDSNHALSNAFGVNAIPHYFTIDSDGVLRAEVLGSGNDVEGKLKKLVAKAKAAQAAQAAPHIGQ